jgi:hypothetical protein
MSDAMREFVKQAGEVMAQLVAEHNAGEHRGSGKRVGCPGCLLAQGR